MKKKFKVLIAAGLIILAVVFSLRASYTQVFHDLNEGLTACSETTETHSWERATCFADQSVLFVAKLGTVPVRGFISKIW